MGIQDPEPRSFNFRTNQYSYDGEIDTDEKASDYIPQDFASQGIFRLKREQGLSISEALLYVINKNLEFRTENSQANRKKEVENGRL